MNDSTGEINGTELSMNDSTGEINGIGMRDYSLSQFLKNSATSCQKK